MFCMQSIFVLCLQVFAFLMDDLTFRGQLHVFRVRNQPLCRRRFDFLESNRRLPNRVHAIVEVVLARSQKCPPKLRPDFYNKGGRATITTLGQLPATMVSNGPK